MSKIIFLMAFVITSIASACKISRAGMSTALISSVTEYAASSMDSNSFMKAVYQESSTAVTDGYIVETVDSRNNCQALLYSAIFDTLNCKVNTLYVSTFEAIPCK